MSLLKAIFIINFAFYACTQNMNSYEIKRLRMIEDQIIERGVNDSATISAMKKVPRHLFVPEDLQESAYNDCPLGIGYNQTISQPYIVALTTELSTPQKGKKVLEIGTGSGYQAAILAEIVDSVYSIEIVTELAYSAKERLKNLGYKNIVVKEGDGYKGWPEYAPFDIIIVTAACNHIPKPLIDQLKDGGRLIMPKGEPSRVQNLILLEKKNGEVSETKITQVVFVPFTRKDY